MKHIGLLLHFYQPPTQDPDVVKRINRECYEPIFEMLSETDSEITVNMNLSLTEQLAELAPETLERVSRLSCCSFTASGAYHPIFPLSPWRRSPASWHLTIQATAGLSGRYTGPGVSSSGDGPG